VEHPIPKLFMAAYSNGQAIIFRNCGFYVFFLLHTQRDRSRIAVRFPVHDGGPKRRRSTDRSADLVATKHRRIAEIRGLENLEIWFFAKMSRKTTSGSGFHFIFEFNVSDLIEKNINIDEVCGRLCEIFEVKF